MTLIESWKLAQSFSIHEIMSNIRRERYYYRKVNFEENVNLKKDSWQLAIG